MHCSRGNVVLVSLIFTDGRGVKRRPAVVVSSDGYHRGRKEAIVAAVTSNITRLLVGDHRIANWRQAGLLAPSVATGIIRTVKQDMVARRLGALAAEDLTSIERRLGEALGLLKVARGEVSD